MTPKRENDGSVVRNPSSWLRSWWVTLRYGSVLTRSGRELRRNLRDDASAYVEVARPR